MVYFDKHTIIEQNQKLMETNLITNIKIKKLLRVRQRQGAKVVFLILNILLNV